MQWKKSINIKNKVIKTMSTILAYLIVFLYILIAIIVNMVLIIDSDSYDKESRKHKDIISVCWILFVPIAIIYLIIMIVKTKLKS